jgi:hypothetical protein
LNDIPTFVVNKANPDSWIIPDGKTPMTYQTVNAGYLNGKKKDITLLPYYQMHHQRYSLYLKIYTSDELDLRNRIVTDELRPSYVVDENSHSMTGEKTELTFQAGHSPALGFNTWEKTRWGRVAKNGGWFSYQMNIDKNSRDNYVVVTYWGNENKDHDFDIMINDVKVSSESLFDKKPLAFYEVIYKVPEEAKGKDRITISFVSQTGKNAGTVFALKTTTDPWKFPNYKFYF